MKALLLRTSSVAGLTAQSPAIPASKVVALSRQDSFSGGFPGEKAAGGNSPRIALHLEVNRRTGGIRRVLSESDVIRSVSRAAASRSMSFPSIAPEEIRVDTENEPACLSLESSFGLMWTRRGTLAEEVGFSGGGSGKGGHSGGDHGSYGGGFGGNSKKIGEYYRQMLKLNPGDPLLLRNYGKYLHEVEGDFERAEECYGRAILASPGDGEVLSLYGKLIWEMQRDGDRARSYFDQAVRASPDDCTVLGSYAHFMWEVDEDDDEEEEEVKFGTDHHVEASPAKFIAAF